MAMTMNEARQLGFRLYAETWISKKTNQDKRNKATRYRWGWQGDSQTPIAEFRPFKSRKAALRTLFYFVIRGQRNHLGNKIEAPKAWQKKYRGNTDEGDYYREWFLKHKRHHNEAATTKTETEPSPQ